MSNTDESWQRETPVYIDPSNPRGWAKHAECARPEYEKLKWCPAHAEAAPEARRICHEVCPVRRECLTWACLDSMKFCILGGYSYEQRRPLKSLWRERGLLQDDYVKQPVEPEYLSQLFGISDETDVAVEQSFATLDEQEGS